MIFVQSYKKVLKCRNEQPSITLVFFWVLGACLEVPGGCLGDSLGFVLEGFSTKMMFF